MPKIKMFAVTWIDIGNCEIATVKLEALSLKTALLPAYNGLSRRQLEAVYAEAVSLKIEEL